MTVRFFVYLLQVGTLIECLEWHEDVPEHEMRQHHNEEHGTKRKVLLPPPFLLCIFSECCSFSNVFTVPDRAQVKNHFSFPKIKQIVRYL